MNVHPPFSQLAAWRAMALLFFFLAVMTHGAEQKMFDRLPRHDLLTTEEKRWLDAHPVIRVAPTQKYEPIESLDAKNGMFYGVTSEYFFLMESRLARRFDYVALSREQWDTLDPVQRGADVITASAAMPERRKYWSYTKPYLSLPTYLITRQTGEDGLTLKKLAGARVAVVRGWAIEEHLRKNHPRIAIEQVLDVAAGLRKASFGEVEAFVTELPVATEWMEREAITNLKIAGEGDFIYDLCIAVRKDWPELLAIFEKALATITPEERRDIYQRWVKIQAPPSHENLNRIALWSGAGLLALLAAAAVWNRSLASRVRTATAKVRAELTRRVETDEALRIAEQRFTKAFRSSPDAIYIASTRDGRVFEANDSAARMLACKKEQIIGTCSLGDGWGWLSAEDRAVALMRLRETGGSLRDYEARQRRMNGEIFTALVSCESIEIDGEPCIIAVARDVTEQRAAGEALRLSEEKFAGAFRNSPDAIMISALADTRIVEINEGVCRLTGYAREEIIGRTTEDLRLWCSEAARLRYREELAKTGRAVEMEAEFRMKDGRTRLGLISGEIIQLRDGPHSIATVRDITERKRAETARQRLVAQLLESEDEERRRIARELHDSTAQHLAAIQMNLTRLRDAAPAAGVDTQLLADSLALTTHSVQEIRTLSYLLHPPMLEELGLAGALTDYAAGFAKRSGIAVEVDAAGYAGRLTRGQELALFRVAQESLANIHRHSGSTSALIRLERDAEEVRLEVQDNGRGLAPDMPPGVGLRGMKGRLSQIGGELSIESDAEGTTVLASVAVKATEAAK